MRWGEGVVWDMGPYFSWGLNIPVISYTVIQIQRSECTSTNTITGILKQGLLFLDTYQIQLQQNKTVVPAL